MTLQSKNKMSSYCVPSEHQSIVDNKIYFKFPLPNGGTRVIWTTAPKDLKKCPRVELNRLVRMFEKMGALTLPTTLRHMKKADILALITPLLSFA